MNVFVRFLARYARRNLPQYLLGAVMLLATNWVVVRIPALIGDALNVLGTGGAEALADANAIALELMVLAVVVVVVRTLSRVLFFNPGRDIEYQLNLDLFAHLLRLQRPFYMRRKLGELVSIASNDTQAVRLLVGFAGLQVCNVAAAIPLHLWQMWRTDAVLTLWCLAPVLVGAIYMRWTVTRFFMLVRDSMQTLARLSDRILELYSGIGTIRSHAAEDAALRRFEERNDDYLRLQLRASSIRAFGMPVLGFSGLVGTGVVLWVGGSRVMQGELQVGHMATFTTLLISLVSILASLAWVLAAVSRGVVSLGRIDEVLQTSPELPPESSDYDITNPPRIEIRNLTFGYPDTGTPALSDINICVEPGKTLGVFGKTGSGKTTLVNLLSRVYTPPPGTIFVDGHDITTISLGVVRSAMAVVPQSSFLFSTTVRNNVELNVALGADPGMTSLVALQTPARPTESHLRNVLDAACLNEDIAQLPQGLDTVVGERGVMLSGGQRQRASLARALYRQQPILLLDDVLSAVDQGTEIRLVQAIRNLRSGGNVPPTTLIVSHRTSVLEHADEIVVFEGGRIVESGTHAELVARGGLYAETHAHQEGHA